MSKVVAASFGRSKIGHYLRPVRQNENIKEEVLEIKEEVLEEDKKEETDIFFEEEDVNDDINAKELKDFGVELENFNSLPSSVKDFIKNEIKNKRKIIKPVLVAKKQSIISPKSNKPNKSA